MYTGYVRVIGNTLGLRISGFRGLGLDLGCKN